MMMKESAPSKGVKSHSFHTKRVFLVFLPFFLFSIFAFFILKYMGRAVIINNKTGYSILQKAPETVLPLLLNDTGNTKVFDIKTFTGRMVLLNFWGSWCQPCQEEHPLLILLANSSLFDLVGINYKDNFKNSQRFLNTHGNPFRAIGYDPQGKSAINWGIYGLPETFLVNTDGTILYHHRGPLTPKVIQEIILPLIHDSAKSDWRDSEY